MAGLRKTVILKRKGVTSVTPFLFKLFAARLQLFCRLQLELLFPCEDEVPALTRPPIICSPSRTFPKTPVRNGSRLQKYQ